MTTRRNSLALAALAAATALGLHLAGHGVLAAPDGWRVEAWEALVRERSAVAAVLTLVRLAALGACGYLLGLGALSFALARSRNRALRRLVRTLTPRLLRPMLGVVATIALTAPAAHAANSGSSPPIMVLVTTTTSGSTSAGPPPTMRRLPDPPPTASAAITTPTTASAPAPAPAPAPTTTAATAPAPTATTPATPPLTLLDVGAAAVPLYLPSAVEQPPASIPFAHTWTVARGDHFWHIAEGTLQTRAGYAPNTGQVAAYWRSLVEANHDRLVDPHNPDLLFAGQELLLPPD